MNYSSEDLDNMTLSEIGGDYRGTLDMLFYDEFADYLSGVDNDRLLVENTDEYVQLPENWTDIVHELVITAEGAQPQVEVTPVEVEVSVDEEN